jgi:hypothetical protein
MKDFIEYVKNEFGYDISLEKSDSPDTFEKIFCNTDTKNKEKIMKALAACSEFCCDECPYQHLDDMDYKLRCIHTLVKDTYKLLKEN